MKTGVIFPQYEFFGEPGEILEFARNAEQMGYDYIGVYDHVIGPNPERPEGYDGWNRHDTDFYDPFVLFAAMAAVTSRVEFATSILILPQRQTVLAAKQAATLDYICGGRLRLGVAVGWNPYEYIALGMDFHTRGRRIEEQVTLMRRLWTEDHVDFKGEWDHVPDMGISPKPIQQPIPIWFGGHSDTLIRRAARIGDGWIPLFTTPQEGARELALYKDELKKAGRNAGIEARALYGNGDPGVWRATADAWRDAGADYFFFVSSEAGLRGPEAHTKAMEKFRNTLG